MTSRSTRGQLDAIRDELSRLREHIEIILMLKEPGTAQATEAYEGLRRAVVAASSSRLQHLAHLAKIDSAIRAGEGPEQLGMLMRDLMTQAGLRRIDDPNGHGREVFQIDGEGAGPLELVAPAYFDTAKDGTAAIVVQGIARASTPDVQEEPGSGEAAAVSTDGRSER